jgi:ABC-type Fe3+ transport system substrate-binding protein
MERSKARLGVIAAVSAALLATACSSGGTDNSTSTPTAGSSSPTVAASTPANSGASQPAASQAAGGPANWQAGAGSDWQDVLAKGRQEGTVVVGGPAQLGTKLSAAFEKDTGIKMQFVSGGGGELSSRFDTEARAKHVTMDILFGGGNELETLKPEGLLEPLKPQMILPSVQDGPQWRDGKRHWYDKEQTYLFQGGAYVFGYVTVNADDVDPATIKSWNDLLDPKYKGKIICYDPTSNGPGQGAVGAMAAVLGMDYIKKLFVDQQVKFVADNDQLAQSVAHGDYPIALALIQQSINKYQSQGINLKIALPSEMPGYLTSGFGVIREAKGAPHPNAAQVFINWYASAAGAQAYQDIMLESCNRLDVDKSKLPEYTVPKAGVKYFDDDLNEDFYVNERQKDIDKITQLLGGR